MNVIHKKRLKLIIIFFVGLSMVVALVLYALNQNINLFYTPSQIAAGEVQNGVRIRIGGMVEKGSVKRDDSLNVKFSITDFENSVFISFKGILPDLFKEGQGVVAEGRLQANKIFIADEILAKHDENYMPPEVKKSLKPVPKGLSKNNFLFFRSLNSLRSNKRSLKRESYFLTDFNGKEYDS